MLRWLYWKGGKVRISSPANEERKKKNEKGGVKCKKKKKKQRNVHVLKY
jgi:hypothetical protein